VNVDKKQEDRTIKISKATYDELRKKKAKSKVPIKHLVDKAIWGKSWN